jgi:aspartyl protease family protein
MPAKNEIRPERGGYYVEERSSILPIIVGIAVVSRSIRLWGIYFYTTAEMFNPYKTTYEKLGIDLPRSFETFGLASRYLNQLKREPCDSVPFTALAAAV